MAMANVKEMIGISKHAFAAILCVSSASQEFVLIA